MGQTPLHRATQHDHKKVVEYLVSKRADPTIVDSFKQTAMDLAGNLKDGHDLRQMLQKVANHLEKKRLEKAKKDIKKQSEHEKKVAEQAKKLAKLEEKRRKKEGKSPNGVDVDPNKADNWIAYINSDESDSDAGSNASSFRSTSDLADTLDLHDSHADLGNSSTLYSSSDSL